MVFFFSSRRRHTRLVSDWSSDVCSSDLTGVSAFLGDGDRPFCLFQSGAAKAVAGGDDCKGGDRHSSNSISLARIDEARTITPPKNSRTSNPYC